MLIYTLLLRKTWQRELPMLMGLWVLVSASVGCSDRRGLRARPVPFQPDFVFVNDGELVLADRSGNVFHSGLPGESPNFSPDGLQVVFTRIERTDRVYPAHNRYPGYGATHRIAGLYVWELGTGKVRQVHPQGDKARFSPDGQRLAFVAGQPEGIHILDLASGKVKWLADGSNPHWVGTECVAYEHELQIYQRCIAEAESKVLVAGKGHPLGPDVASAKNDEQAEAAVRAQLLRYFTGPPLEGYFRFGLRGFAGGKGVCFLQSNIHFGFLLGCRTSQSATIVLHDGSYTTYPLTAEVRNQKHQDIDKLAISPTGVRIAFTQRVGQQLFVDARLLTKERLFVAELRRPADQVKQGEVFDGTRVNGRLVCVLESTDEIAFLGEDELLAVIVNEDLLQVPLGDGSVYRVGLRQLDPAQLSMLALEPSIATADGIYRIDLRTGERKYFASGHNVATKR